MSKKKSQTAQTQKAMPNLDPPTKQLPEPLQSSIPSHDVENNKLETDLDWALIDLSSAAMPFGARSGDLQFLFQDELKPQDSVEKMLFDQILALHVKGMQMLADSSENFRFDADTNLAIKLFRAHHEAIETLNRYRRKGKQEVIVQHVNVNDGGKAVVNGSIGPLPTGGGL